MHKCCFVSDGLNAAAKVSRAKAHTRTQKLLSRETPLEARANDLVTHLRHSRKQTLSHTLVTNNELQGTTLQTPRFTFITRSSAEL